MSSSLLPLTIDERAFLASTLASREDEVMRLARGEVRREIVSEALVLAAGHRRDAMVRLLVGLGADLEHHGHWSRTALDAAVGDRHRSLVRALLELGATPTADARALAGERTADGELHLAARLGDRRKCRAALDAGARLEAESANGSGSAIEIAARRGHLRIVLDLLAHERGGADTLRAVTKRRAWCSAVDGPKQFEGWSSAPSLWSRAMLRLRWLAIMLVLAPHRGPRSTLPPRVFSRRQSQPRHDLDLALNEIIDEHRARIAEASAQRRAALASHKAPEG